MSEKMDVRIVQLEPLHVASALGFGTGPESIAIDTLVKWARERGLLDVTPQPRFFGFDNPMPSPGSPNYGYEFWMTVGPDVTAEHPIAIKDFPGGRYAVTRCKGVEGIGSTWKRFVAWAGANGYQLARHQWLEEQLSMPGLPLEELVLDLYMPIQA